ncbi:MAG: extracellular solute-binding protein [Anaerolineaceae bacterium]|nr:extracellular solute-binding protein [Anaerolineaceae bacterium]
MGKKAFAFFVLVALVVLTSFSLAVAQEPVQISFWHAMSGSRGDVVQGLVDSFNAANPDVQIVAEFTGSYADTLTKALAAVRAGEAPDIVQVYEVGTRSMLDSGAIVPVAEVSGGEFDPSLFVAPIVNYYSVGGELSCMPFNSSTAMLYYNKDIFAAAGLDPEVPPTTFNEVYEMGKQIVESGAAPGAISFGWPAWIMEQMFAKHDQMLANEGNGRDALATETYFNSEFGVQVLTEWQKWAQDGVLIYGGREYSANDPFLAGEFAMLAQSTSSLGGIQKNASFNLGTAFLPRLEGYEDAIGNNVIGGGCLWTMAGKTPEEYNAVWRFYQFLAQDEEAIIWHKGTGYFPVTNSAFDALDAEGWFTENPNFLTAFDQILKGENTVAASGVILGDFVTIRDIVGAAIEEAVVNNVDPREALDAANEEINQLLEDYASLVEPN